MEEENLGWIECDECGKEGMDVGIAYSKEDGFKGLIFVCHKCKKQKGAVELDKQNFEMMLAYLLD